MARYFSGRFPQGLCTVIGLAAVVGAAAPAPALIVHGDTNGTTNPSAHYLRPANDPGWDHVGTRGLATGVYLGNRYVLAAAHVGAGSFALGDTTYAMQTGSAVRLHNPDLTQADLVVFRLTADPGLPMLSISEASPAVGAAVTMMGTGLDRGSELKSYPRPGFPTNPYRGYDASEARAKSWGTNPVKAVGLTEDLGFGKVHLFSTEFTQIDGRAQAGPHDSGGAIFNAAGELAGLMLSVNTFGDQPAKTAVFGNRTFAADLSIYREQILSIITLPGDANRDGRVDGEDFLIWQSNLGNQSGATWTSGDFNGDGRVDGEDFLIWQANFGQGAALSQSGVLQMAPVSPEPNAIVLIGLGAAALLLRRRRRIRVSSGP